MQIKFLDKRLTEFKPATELSAGYDLRACLDKDIWVPPGGQEKIKTGVSIYQSGPVEEHGGSIIVPCAVIMPRSGLGCKGVKPRNTPGLIDADYQGEIVVCLYNESNDSVHIKPMDRIAQLVFMIALHPVLKVVDEFDNITDRGEGGFGSTGNR